MNSYERCMTVLNHGIPDRVPVIPQDHHVAMRYAGFNHGNFHTDPYKMMEAQLRYMEDFDMDGTLIGADTVCLAEAVGCQIAITDDHCPRPLSGCLTDYSHLDKLKLPDPYSSGRMPVWVEATRLIADRVGKDKLVIARADQGAFSLASMMRGMQDFLEDVVSEEYEDEIHELLRYCNECMWVFIEALVQAGAHVVTTGDSISGPGVVSPRVYKEYSYPYEKDITERCHKLGTKFSIHICGKADQILEDWVDTGCDLMELDDRTNFALARKASLGKSTLFGNLNTTLLFNGTPKQVYEASRDLIAQVMPYGDFILSSGCLVSDAAPFENMKAMVDAAKDFGVYPA